MSDAVYPILPGLAWSVIKKAEWDTAVPESTSGREYPVRNRLYPKWSFELPYEFLRQYGSFAEQRALIGFINARGGRFDSWLYRDPDDYIVANAGLGVGDGVTRTFRLVRAYGGFVEPVMACDNVTQVRSNGAPLTYGTGAGQWIVDVGSPNAQNIIFATPPAVGAALDWSGIYYYRCRFLDDAIAFEQFSRDHWKTGSIKFRSVPN